MSDRLNNFTEDTACPFTDKRLRSWSAYYGDENQLLNYSVDTRQGHVHVTVLRRLFEDWRRNTYFVKHRHLIDSAWHNGIQIFDEGDTITFDLVRDRLATSSIPKTPKEKLDNILKSIGEKSEREGGWVELAHYPQAPSSVVKEWYMRNEDELHFYLNALAEQGYLNIRLGGGASNAAMTYQGLQYLASMEESGGRLSKRCFIAMAFSPSQVPARDAMVRAIEDAGYIPVIIDTQHIDSDKTINDRIIAEIRRSKFCIADFTLQRNGVYFEAGFALGLNLPVIYLCEQEDFKHSHFDLKPFQHILYDGADDLYYRLKNKIAAWIQ